MKKFFACKGSAPADREGLATVRQEREGWLGGDEGSTARAALDALLVRLYGGWPRRGKKMLVMNAGNGLFLRNLWEAGFDVTAQDHAPDFLQKARDSLGNRAEYLLASPDHLPCEDAAFDYVVIPGLEYCLNHEAVLQEIHRVVTCGVIILFSNAFSLHRLGWKLGRARPAGAVGSLVLCPTRARKMLRHAFGAAPQKWLSALPAPAFLWAAGQKNCLNRCRMLLPLGAVAGVRVDLLPKKGCTGIVIQARAFHT